MVSQLLKHFARTDGLIKGTAIVSNLIVIASISILPGFGANGLFIANTIQMLIGGFLEVPTGMLSDLFGWHRAVKLALLLKVLVTLVFLLAVIASDQDAFHMVWLFFCGEAIIDSLASAFLSGAYQTAYLDWYQQKLSKLGVDLVKAPPLFLSSFHHALTLRFVLPLTVTAAVMTLQFLARDLGWLTPYTVSYISISIILVLRFAVIRQVWADLSGLPDNKRGLRRFSKLEFSQIVKSARFPIYVNATLVNVFCLFYLMGQVFKFFSSAGVASALAWSYGLLFGTVVYFLRAWLGVVIYPRLAAFNTVNGIINLSIGLGASCLLLGSILALNLPFWAEFSALFLLTLVTALCSEAIQRYVDSSLNEVNKSVRATWLGVANGCGMLLFGALSALVIHFNLGSIATNVFCLVIFVTSAISALRLVHVKEMGSLPSFSQTLTRIFTRSVALIVVFFAILDIFSFYITSFANQNHDEYILTRMILEDVREPLIQGSFVEANSRLKKLQKAGAFSCATLSIWDFKADLCKATEREAKLTNEWVEPITLDPEHPAGELKIYFDRSELYNAIFSRILFTVFLLILCGLVVVWILHKLGRRLRADLAAVLALIEGGSTDAGEVSFLEFDKLASELKEMMQLRSEATKQSGMAELAAQVSHDIRSPLLALDSVMATAHELPESQRILVRSAVSRIKDIANHLLSSYKEVATPERAEVHLISTLIESVVTEKRIQFQSRRGLRIEYELENRSFGLFATVDAGEFKRALSNLIDNAVEALIGGRGLIRVRLSGEADRVFVSVLDNGKGIPESVLPVLGQKGVSFGKEGTESGTGLGLYHAKCAVEGWGGELEIFSQEHRGTCVTLSLLRSEKPGWFADRLKLAGRIVVVDDDNSIHDVWAHRLQPHAHRIEVSHFSSPSEVGAWIRSQKHLDGCLFLVDYEFNNDPQNGLELVAQFGIEDRSVLVTSRFEQEGMIESVEEARLKLLPKSMAGLVPLELS